MTTLPNELTMKPKVKIGKHRVHRWGKAIRRKCLDCQARSSPAVKHCPFDGLREPACELWLYRFGAGPNAAARRHGPQYLVPGEPPDAKYDHIPTPASRPKAIRSFCLACMGGSRHEVRLCPSDGEHSIWCELWPYRFGCGPRSAAKRLGTDLLTPGGPRPDNHELDNDPKSRDGRQDAPSAGVHPQTPGKHPTGHRHGPTLKTLLTVRDFDKLRPEWINCSLWVQLRQRDGRECLACSRPFTESGDTNPTVHHLLPRDQGGETRVSNLVLLCRSCHDHLESAQEAYLDVTQRPPRRSQLVGIFAKEDQGDEDRDETPAGPSGWQAWVYGGQRRPAWVHLGRTTKKVKIGANSA